MQNLQGLTHLAKLLMEGDNMSLIINEIKTDIALELLHTQPNDSEKREELYQTSRALNRLEMKLQEFVNKYEGDK